MIFVLSRISKEKGEGRTAEEFRESDGRRSFQMPPRGRELLAPELQHACHPSGIGQAGGLLELGKRRPIVARVQRLKPVDEIVSHAVV